MRVVHSTIAKFRSFDLVRQLERHGVLERFFTGWPRWKLRGEGLPMEKVTTNPWIQTVYEGLGRARLQRYHLLESNVSWAAHQQHDWFVSRHLPDADIFHAISYCGLRSGRMAQSRGMHWVCEAVNSHLRYQQQLLEEEYRRMEMPFGGWDERFLEYAEASYEGADTITTLSSFARRSFLEMGLPEKKLAQVDFGVDLREFYPVARRRDRAFRVLFVGQLGVRKGIHDLVDAFHLAAIPGSELQLIGIAGRDFDAVMRTRRWDGVSVLGTKRAPDLRRYYSTADVLVLPSIEDAYGYVVAEALACGCPVIATTNTGAPDVVTNGVEGFIVPIRSPQTIAERLVWIREHGAEAEQMRLAAAARARTLGGWDAFGDQIVHLLASRVPHAVRVPERGTAGRG